MNDEMKKALRNRTIKDMMPLAHSRSAMRGLITRISRAAVGWIQALQEF
jgi:hypothetical protein